MLITCGLIVNRVGFNVRAGLVWEEVNPFYTLIGLAIMSERGNEFELWPSRFLGEAGMGGGKPLLYISLVGWPPSTLHAAETHLEMHVRLGQMHVLDTIANGGFQFPRNGV